MKKLFVIAALTLGVSAAQAQSETFKPFKVDFSFGGAMASGSGSKSGGLIALEPKYSISDKITLGLRMEGAFMGRATMSSDGMEASSVDINLSGSYLATGDYFFNTNSFRPFAGLGAGIHKLASASIDMDDFTGESSSEDFGYEGGTKFGFTPRVGFEYGHFRLAAEYNLIGKTGKVNNNYLGFKLGFFLGGGRL